MRRVLNGAPNKSGETFGTCAVPTVVNPSASQVPTIASCGGGGFVPESLLSLQAEITVIIAPTSNKERILLIVLSSKV
jgi:hypothetical protein